jgi:hypothetical protein
VCSRPGGDRVGTGPSGSPRAVLLGGPGGVSGAASDEAGFGILHGPYWLVVRLGERRPTVLLVDAAQWADAPSRQMEPARDNASRGALPSGVGVRPAEQPTGDGAGQQDPLERPDPLDG